MTPPDTTSNCGGGILAEMPCDGGALTGSSGPGPDMNGPTGPPIGGPKGARGTGTILGGGDKQLAAFDVLRGGAPATLTVAAAVAIDAAFEVPGSRGSIATGLRQPEKGYIPTAHSCKAGC